MHYSFYILLCPLLLLISSCADETEKPGHVVPQSNNAWYQAANVTIQKNLSYAPVKGKAKNIILFIGDGMGVSTVTAARIFDGQSRGMPGEENVLSWESFPNIALSKTYNTNQQVPDSAGTATSIMSGVKTKAGVISVDQFVTRGDCASSKGHHVLSFLELAEQSGMATGLISTTSLTHATPATAYAHVPERYWQNDSDIPESEKSAGCTDIAQQFIEFPYGNGIDVTFAGGRENFLPQSMTDPEGHRGKRSDDRNLLSEWQQKHPNGHYVWNEKLFRNIDTATPGPVLGLFNTSHLEYETDRAQDKSGEPSLADMTEKALKILQNKKEGYFLFIEGGRIDHAHHMGNAYRALTDTVALAQAVRKAVEMTNQEDTLIIVTADHSHTLTIGGFPTRGNPILGKVIENKSNGDPRTSFSRAEDKKPYTILGYNSGRSAKISQPRDDLSTVDTTAKDFRQQTLVPLVDSHGGEDVAIYARGPFAHLIRGVVEENYIFHVMYQAVGMNNKNGKN